MMLSAWPLSSSSSPCESWWWR
uniref:Uncharacterized protein n=1 Tax=Arundo donax TaxID=35708 RepID=A0A0A9FS36_ARUDO